MNEALKNLPDILKAVTDPFSLLALMVLVLGFVAYYVIKGQIGQRQYPSASLISLSIVALSFIALTFNIVRVNALQAQKPLNSILDRYNVQITFYGPRKHEQLTTVPFRATSGQVNVGCGDSAPTSVSWNAPADAKEINATASWQNTDGIKSQAQQAAVQGTTATAIGSIAGRDREWTGNCQGGGHGELVLSGTYVINQVRSDERAVLKTVQDFLPTGGTLRVDLPPSTETALSFCDIVATKNQERMELALALQGSNSQSLTLSEVERHGPASFQARIEDGRLVITVP